MTKSVGLAAVCLAAVAACSSTGSSPSPSSSPSARAYSQVLQRIASEENAAQQRVADGFRPDKVNDLRAALRTFESRQAGLAAQVAALMPPADAVGANTELAEAFADSAKAIHSLISRIAHADSVTNAFFVIQSDGDVHRAGEAIGRALEHLTQLGYVPAAKPPQP